MRVTPLILWTTSLLALSATEAMYGGGGGGGNAAPNAPARARGGIPAPYSLQPSGVPATGGGVSGSGAVYGVYVAPPTTNPAPAAPLRARSPGASRPAAGSNPPAAPLRPRSPSAGRHASPSASAAHARSPGRPAARPSARPEENSEVKKLDAKLAATKEKNYQNLRQFLKERGEREAELASLSKSSQRRNFQNQFVAWEIKEQGRRFSEMRHVREIEEARQKAYEQAGGPRLNALSSLPVNTTPEQIKWVNDFVIERVGLPSLTPENIRTYDLKAMKSYPPEIVEAIAYTLSQYLKLQPTPSARLQALAQEFKKRGEAKTSAAAAADPNGSAAPSGSVDLERLSGAIRTQQVDATNALLAEYKLPPLPTRAAGSRQVGTYSAKSLEGLSERALERLERKIGDILPKTGKEVEYDGQKYAYREDFSSGRVEDLLKLIQAQKTKRAEIEKAPAAAAAAAPTPSLTPAQQKNLDLLKFWEEETRALLYNADARAAPFTKDWENAPETLLPFWEGQVTMVNHLVPEAARRDTPGGRKVYENLFREIVALDTILETAKRHPQIPTAYQRPGGLAQAWSRLSSPYSLTPAQVARIKAVIKAERAEDRAKAASERSPVFAKYWGKFQTLHQNWIIEHQEFCRENPTHSACSEI